MTAPAADLTGQRFKWLTVLSRAENTATGGVQWKCRCACGRETITQGGHLRNGSVKSCGCRQVVMGWRQRKHGRSVAASFARVDAE